MKQSIIEERILLIRGLRVMLDTDLAELYGTSTRAINQAVKRNSNRFPSDFMFQLSAVEKEEVVTNCDHLAGLKYSRNLPYAFTEHGAIMAANVLNSARAVEMSVFIVRAFVKIREALSTSRALAGKLAELEQKVGKHDEAIHTILMTIHELMGNRKSALRRKIDF